MNLTITDEAQQHFMRLIKSEAEENLHLRLNVENPGTVMADLGITFCSEGEQEATDVRLDFDDFVMFVSHNSIAALENAIIGFNTNELGGELTVKAPYIKGRALDPNANLFERVQILIDEQVNPFLAKHGGLVQLKEVTNDNKVLLEFGGGCQGCGMAKVTMQNSIEKILLEHCPDISQIQDITAHAEGDNPYYA